MYMITSNQIIERVEQTQKCFFQNDEVRTMTNSIMKVRIPSNPINDKVCEFYNQYVPSTSENIEKTLWEELLSVKGFVSKFVNFEQLKWSLHEGYWETSFVFYGSPIDVVNKIRRVIMFNFKEQYYYFDTENKFGFISYNSSESEKWFIRKTCVNYFKVFAHYLRTFKEYLDQGNKFNVNLVERLGTKKMDVQHGMLNEEWDNDLYFNLSKDVNFDTYLESFKQIKMINSELREKTDKTIKDPWTKFVGQVDLSDLTDSISGLENFLNSSLETEKEEIL